MAKFTVAQNRTLTWDLMLPQRVLDTLDPQHSVNARENAAIVLGAIARSNVSPLTHKLGAHDEARAVVHGEVF